MLISFDREGNEIKIPIELEKSIKQVIINFDEKKSRERDKLNFLIVGIMRVFYILSKKDFYDKISYYYTMSFEELENYIETNKYFDRHIGIDKNVYFNIDYINSLEFVNNNQTDIYYEHWYEKEEIISIGKCWYNLEDPDILKLYNFVINSDILTYKKEHILEIFLESGLLEPKDGAFEFILSFLVDDEENIEEANRILQIMMSAYNNMPKWLNFGVSPNILIKYLASEQNEEDRINFAQIKKIGRNDLCYCGSGDKYKKCCLNSKQLIKKGSLLTKEDATLFYKLFTDLCFFVNQKHNLFPNIEKVSDIFNPSGAVNANCTLELKEILWKDNKTIIEYIKKNKDALSLEEISILESWKKRVKGHFFIYEYIDSKAIMLSSDNKVYEVSGIISPISEQIPAKDLPVMVETVLLPFKDRIIYDSIISRSLISLGPNMLEQISKEYYEAKVIKKI